MAKSVNKVILIGNLGNDPELRYTGNSKAVCNFTLATNESYKDAIGEWVEKAEWHNIVAWAKLAELCGEYLNKGSQVYVEGSLQTRNWEDGEGITKYKTEVKAREIVFMNAKGDQQARQQNHSKPRNNPRPPRNKETASFFDNGDDDLPF